MSDLALSSSIPLVVLGTVVRSHGVHGDVRVRLHNPDSALLLSQPEVLLRREGSVTAFRVTSARLHQKAVALLHLEGCSSRDGAEKWRAAEVCVPRNALPAPAESEYYLVDLVGLRAVGREGEAVGLVENVLAYPAANVLRIRAERGVGEVPALPPYLVKVDLAAGQVVVDHLEDLEWESGQNKGSKS